MRDDPDGEVKRWEWIKIPIREEILNNLHAPKNVTLKLLGLQQWKKDYLLAWLMLVKPVRTMLRYKHD